VLQTHNENEDINLGDEESPDPFITALTRARFIIICALGVFVVLGLVGFISFWPGFLGALAISIAALVSVWPKDIEHFPELTKTDMADEVDGFSPADFIEAIPDPILALNVSGDIIFFNESVIQMLGRLEVGQHISAAIRAPNVLDAIELVNNGAEPMRVSYDVRGDIERNFDVHVAALSGRQKTHGLPQDGIATLLVLGDLTQQERIESMRADFVANVSHELRTPLASLLGFIETIKGSARNDAEAQEKFLDIMHDQAERMTRLINDLLSLSRIEMNVHQPPSGRVDVKTVIEHVSDVLLPVAKANKVALNVHIDTDTTTIPGERDELIQVFQNLMENAIKYGGPGKSVDISLSDGENDKLCATIRDYGPGIAPENVPRLTERFYRVDVLESREKGGTGLGLAIVKHILNRHRAQLAIKSTLGEGSEFSINFARSHL